MTGESVCVCNDERECYAVLDCFVATLLAMTGECVCAMTRESVCNDGKGKACNDGGTIILRVDIREREGFYVEKTCVGYI